MHSKIIMNDIIVNNYFALYNILLPITVLPLLQAVNLVTAHLKIPNTTITSTLASNILPFLTSDI